MTRRLAQTLLGMVFLVLMAGAQIGFTQSVPLFDVDAVTMPEPSTLEPQLDIYTRVPYSSLSFISQRGEFVSQYTVLAELYRVDEDGDQTSVVVSRIWERTVPPVSSYDATQSHDLLDFTTHTIKNVPPGVYVLEVLIEDGFAGSSYVKQTPVRVRPMQGRASLSDILLADTYDEESKSIVPSVTNVVNNDRGMFILYYEIAAQEELATRVTYSVNKIKQADDATSVKALLGLASEPESNGDNISFEALNVLELRQGRNPAALSIPLEEFEVGDFAVDVALYTEDGTELDRARRVVSVRWMGLQDQISDVEVAVDQLAYIAKNSEIDWIKSADTDAERARRFETFWKKRDPTPLSERNERMEEYYFRIAHANREYGNFSSGWQTDRGQVYVLYGEPDYIERKSYAFGTSKPYEVWTYNSFGRQFVFIDRTGVGDYEIMIPIWDERTRIR